MTNNNNLIDLQDISAKTEMFYCTIDGVELEVEMYENFKGDHEVLGCNVLLEEYDIEEEQVLDEFESYKDTQMTTFCNLGNM